MASLPSCDARIRPPAPLQKWRRNGLVALMRRAHKAAEAGGPPCGSLAIPTPLPKHGGATASLPLCPARISPQGGGELVFQRRRSRRRGLARRW